MENRDTKCLFVSIVQKYEIVSHLQYNTTEE